jgi:hypothetical protein
MNLQPASFMPRSKAKRKENRVEGVRNDAALQILENEGFEIGAAAIQRDGRVQIRVSSRDDSAMVEVGQELWDFAAGLVTLPEIKARRKFGQ